MEWNWPLKWEEKLNSDKNLKLKQYRKCKNMSLLIHFKSQSYIIFVIIFQEDCIIMICCFLVMNIIFHIFSPFICVSLPPPSLYLPLSLSLFPSGLHGRKPLGPSCDWLTAISTFRCKFKFAWKGEADRKKRGGFMPHRCQGRKKWRRERGRERENFRSPANGVGMRFEDLILHAPGFFVQLTNMTCLTV